MSDPGLGSEATSLSDSTREHTRAPCYRYARVGIPASIPKRTPASILATSDIRQLFQSGLAGAPGPDDSGLHRAIPGCRDIHATFHALGSEMTRGSFHRHSELLCSRIVWPYFKSRTDRRLCAAGSGSQCRCYVRFCLRSVLEQLPYPVPPCLPGAPPPTPVVLGVVVATVVGDEDGGGGSAAPAGGAGAGAACGAGTGSGAADVGSLATMALAALVGGVVMAGGEGGAVVGTAVVCGLPGRSSSLRTAIIDPKPTRNAATQASGSTTARPPILAKKERRPSSSSAASIDSRLASSCRRGAPSDSASAAGSVGEVSASRGAAGSVAFSPSGTRLVLTSEVVTIGRAPATDSLTKPNPRSYFVERSKPERREITRGIDFLVKCMVCRSSRPATGVFLARSRLSGGRSTGLPASCGADVVQPFHPLLLLSPQPFSESSYASPTRRW